MVASPVVAVVPSLPGGRAAGSMGAALRCCRMPIAAEKSMAVERSTESSAVEANPGGGGLPRHTLNRRNFSHIFFAFLLSIEYDQSRTNAGRPDSPIVPLPNTCMSMPNALHITMPLRDDRCAGACPHAVLGLNLLTSQLGWIDDPAAARERARSLWQPRTRHSTPRSWSTSVLA